MDQLVKHVGDYARFSAAMIVCAEMAPHRMTISQVIFFVTAGAAVVMGKRPTYTDIKEAIGDEVGRSLNTTYRVLLERSRVYPNALEWLRRETNPADNREQIFDLTPKGRKVLREIAEAMA